MTSGEDTAYKKSVRNTVFLLIVVVIVLVAGLTLPAFFTPAGTFSTETMVGDPNGLTLNLGLNATHVLSPYGLVITVWINGSSAIDNITAQDSWPVNQTMLWRAPCVAGWPIGIGVMSGYYDQYNYSSGVILPLKQQAPLDCQAYSTGPQSFLVEAEGSKAIASTNGSDETWDLLTTLVLTRSSFTQIQTPGEIFTIIGTDEWGDVTILHFVT